MTSERLRPEDLGFGRLFERIRDAVIVADAETQRIALWNQAAARMFGHSASEAMKLRVEELIPEPLKTALDESAIVAITDKHGKISYVNDKFC